jgi:pimeloyl-ACP methyl ester carboxylesterase
MTTEPSSQMGWSRETPTRTPHDAELVAALAALLARYAPEARALVTGRDSGAGAWRWATAPAGAWWSCQWLLLGPILSALARHRRALVVDLPGHGLADPFDYRSVDPLDVHVAHARRNIDSMLSLVSSVGALGGLRRHLVLGARWEQLRPPTLILCGERDDFMRPDIWASWARFATRNARLQVVRLPNAGHLIWLDELERVVEEVERFLRV